MKIDVIDLYKQDFKSAYVVNNKDKRKRVILIGKDNTTRKGMLLARYRYEEKYGKIPEGYKVDHIDNDKTNDELSNLQILTQYKNNIKSRKPARISTLECPICHKQFEFLSRNLSSHPNPCCSRSCGNKKGHITNKLKSESKALK